MERRSVLDRCFKILVTKFDENNPKGRGRSLTWVKISTQMIHDAKYQQLSAGAKLLWIYLLSECAKCSTREVYVHHKDITRYIHVTDKSLTCVLHELTSLQWIRILSAPKERKGKGKAMLRDLVEHSSPPKVGVEPLEPAPSGVHSEPVPEENNSADDAPQLNSVQIFEARASVDPESLSAVRDALGRVTKDRMTQRDRKSIAEALLVLHAGSVEDCMNEINYTTGSTYFRELTALQEKVAYLKNKLRKDLTAAGLGGML